MMQEKCGSMWAVPLTRNRNHGGLGLRTKISTTITLWRKTVNYSVRRNFHHDLSEQEGMSFLCHDGTSDE